MQQPSQSSGDPVPPRGAAAHSFGGRQVSLATSSESSEWRRVDSVIQCVKPPGCPASTTIDPPTRAGAPGTVTASRILKSARMVFRVAMHAM
jgi:hypothetical protein